MASEMNVPFLGALPLDPRLLQCCEAGKSFIEAHPDSPAAAALENVWKQTVALNAGLHVPPSRADQEDDEEMVL